MFPIALQIPRNYINNLNNENKYMYFTWNNWEIPEGNSMRCSTLYNRIKFPFVTIMKKAVAICLSMARNLLYLLLIK